MITHSIACWWCLFHWLHVGPDNKTENMKMVIPPPSQHHYICLICCFFFFFCRKEGCRWWKCRYGWYSKENDTCQRYCLCVCFSFRWFIVDQGACVHIKAYNSLSLPTLGYELLFQPEVVRVYTSLLKESQNPSVLEAAAGAIQNLCAGRWTVSIISYQWFRAGSLL